MFFLGSATYQGKPLRELPARSIFPDRGVYFFQELGECRTSNPNTPRIVRVGTHAVSSGSRSTLHGRLKTHLGTSSGGGNHRGSIFRLHVGRALLARDGIKLETWGVGYTPPPDVRSDETIRAAEKAWEKRVSEHIRAMPVLWVNVSDEPGRNSKRAFIERKETLSLCSQTRWLPLIKQAKIGWAFSAREVKFVPVAYGT